MPTPIYPIVHLAIDVQTDMLAGLRVERRQTFPAQIRNFADQIRPFGIPTIFASLQKSNLLYAAETAWSTAAPQQQRDPALLSQLGLAEVGIYADEDVVAKGQYNTLAHPQLLLRLSEMHTRTLLVTGMNTAACIVSTAQNAPIGIRIVSDLLADANPSARDASPRWHRETLKDFLGWSAAHRPNIEITLHSLVMRGLQRCPVRPEMALGRPLNSKLKQP